MPRDFPVTHEYPTHNVSTDGANGPPSMASYQDRTSGQTAIGEPTRPAAKPMVKPAPQAPHEAERVPAMVPDLFTPSQLLDLTAVSLPNFNLVDGTVAIATDPQMPFVLFKGYNPDTWFYAPRWARIALNPVTGEPAFMVTKKVRNNPDGTQTTVGGVLSFMIDLVVELPSQEEQKKWTNLIKTLYRLEPGAGAFNFQPLRLSPGKMDISGLDPYVLPGQPLKNIDVGASSSVGFAFELNAEGADHFAAMLGAPTPVTPQVAILITFKYQYLIPQCDIQSHGFKKKAYDYFSWNLKARASYFGLVNGSFDYQSVRADLRSTQAYDVSVVGSPPPGVDLQKLLDATFDMFLKMQVGEWIQPDAKPVETSQPGGFFGGVSVSMKNVSLSDTAQFNEHMSFSGISEGIHQVSFNFEQQVGAFSPAKHLFIEQDDIKLPFKLAIGNCEKVRVIAPSASYTTATGPRTVQCNAVDGKNGGLTEGTIQFTWPQRPTSAQISLVVNFISPFGPGYEFRVTKPVSDTGAAFLFEPDQFIQRTRLFFVMAVTVTDLSSKALFQWEWTPPQTSGTARPKMSGFFLITPDPNGNPNNLPTYDIEFPYHPEDWTGESTPKIQYKVQGLTGEWKNRTAAGSISIGDASVAVDWSQSTSIGGILAIPAALTQAGPDPAYRNRLLALRSQAMQRQSQGYAGQSRGMMGTDGAHIDRSRSLGAVPGPGEPSLFAKEQMASASYAASGLATQGITAYAPAYPKSYDLRDVNGQNFITSIKDQGYCGSCVAFGVCATVEGTLQVRRNNPNLNPDFSEAHLFYCLGHAHGRTCGNWVGNPPAQELNGGWFPGGGGAGALDDFQLIGVADEACFPYASPSSPFEPTLPCASCSDWSGRVTKINSWTILGSTYQMKDWLSGGNGPLVATISIYQDFMDFFKANNDPAAIYRKGSDPGNLVGGHCISVVGYNDDDQCWICKNSWGPYWAASGFFKIGYGEVGIDLYMWGVDIS